MENDHRPKRPQWDCQACGLDWPCDPAREYLTTDTGGGTRLAMLMWIHLEHFAQDAGPGPFAGAFERFIAWTRAT
jgi:hypothetical protein